MNIFIIFLHKLFTSARGATCFLQHAFVCLQNNFNSCGQIMIKTQKKNFFLRFFSIALISNTGGVVACQRSMLSECFVTFYYKRGQYIAVDCNSPISIVLHLKLISTVILKKVYSIAKCAYMS